MNPSFHILSDPADKSLTKTGAAAAVLAVLAQCGFLLPTAYCRVAAFSAERRYYERKAATAICDLLLAALDCGHG